MYHRDPLDVDAYIGDGAHDLHDFTAVDPLLFFHLRRVMIDANSRKVSEAYEADPVSYTHLTLPTTPYV